MKKISLIPFFYAILLVLLIGCLISLPSYYSAELHATTFSNAISSTPLSSHTVLISNELKSISQTIESYTEQLTSIEQRLLALEEKNASLESFVVNYYLDKLKDPTYITTYNTDYTYYIAAESLGQMGKPAIPGLIHKLTTPDDYERALVLYALLLASQADNMQEVCGNDYIHTQLDFDARNHPTQVQSVLKWWKKYASYFPNTAI